MNATNGGPDLLEPDYCTEQSNGVGTGCDWLVEAVPGVFALRFPANSCNLVNHLCRHRLAS